MFEAARETRPDDVLPLVGLVALYLQNENIGKAYEFAREATTLKPDDPRALLALGMTEMRREDYTRAIDNLRCASFRAPVSAMIQFELAKAYLGAGKTNDARFSLQKAVELAPDNTAYVKAAVETSLAAGAADDAAQLAQWIIEANPDLAEGYRLLALAKMATHDYAEAAAEFARALEREPSEALVIQQYDAMAKARDPNARAVLVEWVDKHPGDWRARFLIAQLHHRAGDIRLATEAYEGVLESEPTNLLALNNLAWAYDTAGDPRALEVAERVYTASPHVGTYTDTLGWMLFQYGDAERGITLLRRAVQQAPSAAEIRYHLAVALSKTGEVDEARLLLTEIVNREESFESKDEARSLLAQL